MNKGSESLFKYMETTDDVKFIKKHTLNSNILVQYYSLHSQLHVSRVFNYSLCSTSNKFTINKTEAYTNDRSKKHHKFNDGKILKCVFMPDYKFYKWLGENKAIILTTNNEKNNSTTLDPDVISLVRIIRKSRIREKNLKNICTIYNKISSYNDKYTLNSSSMDNAQTIVSMQNYKEIAYLLLETEKKIKNFNLLQCEKNRVIRVNCQYSIKISNDSSILSSIEKVQNITALDIFLENINAHI